MAPSFPRPLLLPLALAVPSAGLGDGAPVGRGPLLRGATLPSLGEAALPGPKALAGEWRLPQAVGLGTGGLRTAAAVALALRLGYRLLDTAAFYANEEAVGRAARQELAAGRVGREELVVTTKVWWTDLGFERTKASLAASLSRLGLDFVDLALVHWPGRWLSSDRRENAGLRKGTWRALEELVHAGKVRAIGVSNYTERHLDETFSYCSVPPAVNQIELHPYNQQRSLLAACRERNVQVEAYSPLASSRLGLLQDPALLRLARQKGATPAQVVLQWLLQRGAVPIPKSGSPTRLAENLAAPACVGRLSEEEAAAVDALDRAAPCDVTAPLLGGVGLTDPRRIA